MPISFFSNKTTKIKSYYLIAIVLLFSGINSYAFATDKKTATQQFSAEDFSHWLNIAYTAAATYKTEAAIEKTLLSQGYTLSHYHQLEGYSVAFIIATNDKTRQHLIAIRGTSNAENVALDAAFVLVPDKLTGIDIHQGFLLASRDIYQRTLAKIKPGYTINTTGHSLGGAAAVILAMMFDAQGYTVGEVITFGQPKVTNITGSRKFKHLKLTRLVTAKDVVPLIPPLDPTDLMNLSIFWHLGTEVILFKSKQYAVLTGVNSMLRASDFLNDSASEQHLNNHYMSSYIHHLRSKINTAEQIKYKSDFKFSNWFGTSSK